MFRVVILLMVSIALTACAEGAQTVNPVSPVDGPGLPATTSAVASPATTSTASTTTVEEGDTPAYDVFLAAVADTLDGTRFEGAPFEDPEVFAATGLLFCERIAAGAAGDDVILEYVTELAGGDATLADSDQLVLAGALMGAATEAMCPLEAR